MRALAFVLLVAPIFLAGVAKLVRPRQFEAFVAEQLAAVPRLPSLGRVVAAVEVVGALVAARVGMHLGSAVAVAGFYVAATAVRSRAVQSASSTGCGCVGGLEDRVSARAQLAAVALLAVGASAATAAVGGPLSAVIGGSLMAMTVVHARRAFPTPALSPTHEHEHVDVDGANAPGGLSRRKVLTAGLLAGAGALATPTVAMARTSRVSAGSVDVTPLSPATRSMVSGTAAWKGILKASKLADADIDWAKAAVYSYSLPDTTMEASTIVAVPLRGRPGLLGFSQPRGIDVAVHSINATDGLAFSPRLGYRKLDGPTFAALSAETLAPRADCAGMGGVCCGICGFTGPGWGNCCGVCAIGTLICILLFEIPPTP